MVAQNANPTPNARRPGRPRGGAISAEQRGQLLDIALNLFAQQGVAETSLNAIARAASVSPAMLHYYFQSREALLDVIIAERFLPLRQQLSRIFSEHPDDPINAITRMTETFASLVEQHHWFAPLWMQEVSGGLLKERMLASHGRGNHEVIIQAIERWQQQGKLNPALSPWLLVTSLVSLILVPAAQRQSGLLDASVTHETIRNHALALLRQGILQ